MKPLPPIYSSHDEDLSMREAIERFVVGLAESIDGLQEAELQGELGEVERLSQDLVRAAAETGYPVLEELGRATVVAAQSKQAETVRKHLIDLTEIAQRVRKGSRGAA